MNNLRFALIGCGALSRYHAQSIAQIDGTDFVAWADVSPDAAAANLLEFGGEYSTADAQCIWNDDSIDAVYICTRHDSHAPLAIAAARAGKHILIEKPLASKSARLAFAPPRARPGHTLQQAIEAMAVPLEKELDQVWPDAPDLVVLPETCDRYEDFSPVQMREYSDARSEQILERLAAQARQHNCYIAYSTLRVLDDGTLRNSVFLLDRRGEIPGLYDKNHLVISETKEGGVLPGGEANVIECGFGRVACASCFDLNFDELRLQYKAAKPDLILFPSMFHGGLMQEYWAYSCRAHLDYNRDRLRALKKNYGMHVTIADPDLLGSVLISSELDEVSALEMTREFEIELLDDYLTRSLKHHCDAKRS